jgi:hypothetical protein
MKTTIRISSGVLANRHWSRPSYLAPIQLLHALSVGSVAEAPARTRLAAQFNR